MVQGVACDEDPKPGVLKQLEAMAGKTGKQREKARQDVSGVNNARAIERSLGPVLIAAKAARIASLTIFAGPSVYLVGRFRCQYVSLAWAQ